MLTHARKKHRELKRRVTSATDVLYDKMHTYNKEAKVILQYLIEQMLVQNKNSPALKSLYQLMQRADDIAIDCAHKLAPYQSPKLESIEVRNNIEHKFVMRAPTPIATVDEWMTKTGAKVEKITNTLKGKPISPIEPSIHDFEEPEQESYDSTQDELETQKRMLN